jgi:deazaflavin-dependent oxidoreductase (nitroreductase family)
MGWVDDRSGEEFCYLTTIGRRTGRPHEIEIWFGSANGVLYMLAGGHRSDWVLNARVNPEVAIRIGQETRRGHARLVIDPTEEALARGLLADKYDEREPDGSLDEWARTALPVAVDFPEQVP